MSATDPITPEPHRFSIRLLRPAWIGLATVVLVVVAVGLRVSLPIYRQQKVVQEIQRLGGKIKSRPAGPQWLRDQLGYELAELLNEVTFVSLSDTHAVDATVARLKRLPHLETLSLANTQVTNAGLVHLNGLTKLEWLALGGTQVTNDGLAHLKDLPILQTLQLDNTQVTDTGLLHLEGLTSLEVLSLDNTKASDAGVVSLQRALPDLTIYR
jgi:hypothetical protein